MNTTARITKSINFNRNIICIVIVLFIATITGIAIADEEWLYLGIIFIPIMIYLCIERTFIFPFGLYAFLLPFEN